MESLHLPFAIALASISASSLGLLGFSWFRSRSRDSKVSLPTAADEPLSTSHEVNDDAEVDPFDVTKPEDFVDGFALEEDAFWAKMRLRKMGISLVLAIIVAANGALLGWLLAAGKDTKAAYQATFLELFASIYILVISLISIFQTEVKPHWNLTVHLTTLSSISFFLFATRIVLPGPHHKAFHLSLQSSTIRTCGYLNAVPYLLVAFLAGTARRSPDLHYPPELAYSSEVAHQEGFPASNVCGIVTKSLFSFIFFDYITPVVFRGYGRTLNVQDLPLLPSRSRATIVFSRMREATKRARLSERWRSQPGSGWELMRRLLRLNARPYLIQAVLAVISSILYYGPAFFLQRLVQFLEKADSREHMDRSWGWIYCAGLFLSNAISYLIAGQLWMVSTTTLQVNLRIQLNTILFAKTLVRKDVSSTAGPSMSTTHLSSAGAQVAHQGSPTPSASSSVSDLTSTAASTEVPTGSIPKHEERIPDEDDFSGKAQVMTLMTTDVDRVAEFSTHFSSLIDAPMEILIGSIFLYHLLGASSFVGLAVTCLFLPLNHYGSKVVFRAQDALMKTRDERVSLMNEILGGMRMLKFMAWERSYEARVLRVRDKELHYQRRNFFIETFFNTVWAASPVLVTVVAFWHYAVVRGIPLTPSVAFTSLSVFNELKFALNALPETFISMLQSFVSVRRIEKYLNLAEVKPVKPLELSPLRLSTFSTEEELPIVLNNATITWPQDQSRYPQWLESSSSSSPPSAVSTPGLKFVLLDLTLNFPKGELSLICGKLGSGKTLLLLGLLGEADLLGGQIICPRSPPDVIAKSAELRSIPDVEWIVPGVCAYVPQTAWLQNATIRDNILFNLPYNEQRYRATVEACCLLTDFEILEDGDHSEIGERGVTLSGGQKARVSLARAIYSRASILLLDDVLSAVDAHTASNIYENALKGPLTKNRTVILVSHHVQLTAPGASYIVALDNGQLRYAGDRQGFKSSGVMSSLVQSTALETPIIMMETKQLPPDDLQIGDLQLSPPEGDGERSSDAEVSDTMVNSSEGIDSDTGKQKKPRKLIQEEQRAFGNIRRRIWLTYVSSCGGYVFWLSFAFVLLFASISPVIENGWLKIWSAAYKDPDARSPLWYMSIYAGLTAAGLIIATIRWLVLYQGSIHASRILYQRLLESVLFANIRFHDTTNRGRLLNRFGKDFEGLDSSLATNMGRTLIGSLTVATTFITVAVIGGPWFILAALFIAMFFYRVAVVYSHTSRDLRRLDSVTRSPLYTIYGESIGGATVLRAFGASTKFLREMHQLVNTNNVCYYWMLSVNRWLNIRFNLLSSAIVGLVGVVILWNPKIDAALAGFLLSFVQSVSNSLILMTRRFVGLEQSMVALERVDEYSYLPPEGPEYMEPRPPASWPHDGAIQAENLVVRYAPNLPNVLHGISFEIEPRSKIGILGRTGCGKSTLALSFFRFVQATEGRIVIDGIDISQVGLTDLRSRLTIIPQDPTILSGTLRSTLDVFNQYEDHEIFDALRRVHLIPAEDDVPDDPTMINANVFRNLDSPVAENGENFSSGEKQLLCMARAILKRSKVLFMDEATASVDYATDELISKTIRREFAESTILCIAHRLRTVIDYDKVLILDKGRVVEYDRPSVLLENPDSHFYALCQSTGRAEFRMLKRMADEAAERNRR